ncbi:MAG: type II toxin-antitoxin system HicB family antitoxin, partial [Anaerovorax sp.]
GFTVNVPDFGINTQGDSMADAMFMARDAISMLGCYHEDESKDIPDPSSLDSIAAKTDEIKTLVDVDFDLYRKRTENKAVRKNCTIPSWLNLEAEKAGINFSATLQEALKHELGL